MSLAIERVDLFVLLAYLLAVVVIGVSVGRGAKDISAYLLGDRHLPWWAILGSIVATETSTATFLSVPGMAFDSRHGDLRFLQLALGFIAGRVLIVWLLLPWYFRGELFTAYQLLEERFGSADQARGRNCFSCDAEPGRRPASVSNGHCVGESGRVSPADLHCGDRSRDDLLHFLRRA